jgi:single-strand DNA-binding protein
MSNSITIKGTVHHIGDVETFASGFTKRLLVVDNGEQYDSTVPIEFKKDKGDLLNALRVGQEVTVHVNLGGREHGGRYFPSLSGWKIEAAPVAAAPVADEGEDDELGF